MLCRCVSRTSVLVLSVLWAASIATTQETTDQTDALALLAKIDGKAKFDPAHPKRVVAIDL